MAENILIIHSYFRWIVVVLFLFSLSALFASFLKKELLNSFKIFHKITSIGFSIQLLIGLYLYSISPLILQAVQDIGGAMKVKEIRFFFVEHTFIMFIVVGLFHFGSAKVKKIDIESSKKLRTLGFIYLTLILLMAYGIPFWNRPLFR